MENKWKQNPARLAGEIIKAAGPEAFGGVAFADDFDEQIEEAARYCEEAASESEAMSHEIPKHPQSFPDPMWDE